MEILQQTHFTIKHYFHRVFDCWIWKQWDLDLCGSMPLGTFISSLFQETCENDNKYSICKKLFFVESGNCGNFHIISALWQLNSCLRTIEGGNYSREETICGNT